MTDPTPHFPFGAAIVHLDDGREYICTIIGRENGRELRKPYAGLMYKVRLPGSDGAMGWEVWVREEQLRRIGESP